MKLNNCSRIQFLAGALFIGAIVAGCNPSTTTSTDTSSGNTSSGSASGTVKRPAMATDKPVVASGNTIKIGVVASISGDQKPWGEDSVNGAKLAVDEFNKAGGLNGKQVEMDVQDSQSSPQVAKSAADKAISDGVIGIVGEVSSGNTIEIANSCFEAAIPDVAVGATKTTLTDIGNNVFRVCYTDAFQGPVMANFAYTTLGLHKVAVMTDNKLPYSQGLSQDFETAFLKLGGTIVDEEKYESGASSFTTQLTNLQAKDPEGIFCSGYFTEVGPIVAAARAMGLSVPMFGGDGWDSPKILQSGGQAILKDCYFCNHYTNEDPSPAVQSFLAKWKTAYGGVPGTTMGALGYDAMAVTLQALKDGGKADSVSLRNALANISDFKGVSGDITLKGAHGNPPKRALVVQIGPMTAKGFQKPVKAYVPGPDGQVLDSKLQ